MWVCACMCSSAFVCTVVLVTNMQAFGRPEVNASRVSSMFLHRSFQTGFSTEPGAHQLARLTTSELRNPPFPTPQCWDYRWPPLLLHECQRLELGASCLCSRHFTNVTTSLVPPDLFLKEPCMPAEWYPNSDFKSKGASWGSSRFLTFMVVSMRNPMQPNSGTLTLRLQVV